MTDKRRMLLERLIQETRLLSYPTDRQIRLALTLQEWQGFKRHRDVPGTTKPPREVVSNLHKYLGRSKDADKLFFRAEVLSRRHGRWKTIVRSYKQAEQLYVAALESLEEALVDYPVIYEWLDRHVSFDHHDCNVSPDPDGVPRLINSLSQFNARTPTNKKRKREFLLSVLQDSLYQLEHGITLAIQNRAKDRDDRLSQLCNGIDLNEEPTFEYEV